MHSIRRSCQSALQSNNATNSVLYISRRAFSRSAAAQRGALPVFLEASNPELSSLLLSTNTRVLLPLHLNKEQAKLVFKQENAAKLASEPIEVTLGDVTLPLEHIDRNKDVPNRWDTLRKIMAASRTPEDWENVLRVVEGYRNAGIRIPPWRQAQIVRKLGIAGYQHLVLKALQRAGATGLRLRDAEVVREVVRAVRDKPAMADWEQEELKKACSMAEQVVELMDGDEHCGKQVGALDHRSDPKVMALPLEMAAELAYRYEGDVEKVKKYAQRLMTALEQHDFASADIQSLNTLAARREQDFSNTFTQVQAVSELTHLTYGVVPLWNGLSTARTVLEDAMPMPEHAERVQRELYAAIKAAQEAFQTLGTRGGEALKEDARVPYIAEAVKKCEDDE